MVTTVPVRTVHTHEAQTADLLSKAGRRHRGRQAAPRQAGGTGARPVLPHLSSRVRTGLSTGTARQVEVGRRRVGQPDDEDGVDGIKVEAALRNFMHGPVGWS